MLKIYFIAIHYTLVRGAHKPQKKSFVAVALEGREYLD